MKMLLILTTLVCMNSAFAMGVSKLERGDISVSEAQAQLVSTKKICPSVGGGMGCMAFGSISTVKVTLSGCADRLGGYFSRFEVINGKGYLFFSAVNIFNEKSRVIRCVQAPFHNIDVQIPFEGKVELVKLEYTGTTLPQY